MTIRQASRAPPWGDVERRRKAPRFAPQERPAGLAEAPAVAWVGAQSGGTTGGRIHSVALWSQWSWMKSLGKTAIGELNSLNEWQLSNTGKAIFAAMISYELILWC